MRMGRKPSDKGKSQDVLSLVNAHKEAVVRNDERPSSPSVFKLAANKRASPNIRHSNNNMRNKMKKLQPKKSAKAQEDFSWFESDKTFGFTE